MKICRQIAYLIDFGRLRSDPGRQVTLEGSTSASVGWP